MKIKQQIGRLTLTDYNIYYKKNDSDQTVRYGLTNRHRRTRNRIETPEIDS